MKVLSLALLLMATLAFVLLGCSEKSAAPVSPTDQSVQTPASLEKSNKVDFTFTEKNTQLILPPAKMWTAGRVLQIRDAHAFEAITAIAEPRVTGTFEHYLSLSLDVVTGEGPCHGSFTLTPNPAIVGEGAVWEGTYEGYRSKTSDPLVFALPLKLVAHGRGGNIDGMQAKMTITLTVLTNETYYPAPIYWWGTDGAGTITEH